MLLHRDVPQVEARRDRQRERSEAERSREDHERGDRENRHPESALVPAVDLRFAEGADPAGHVVSRDDQTEEDREDREVRKTRPLPERRHDEERKDGT
jgi:hypothetical protein